MSYKIVKLIWERIVGNEVIPETPSQRHQAKCIDKTYLPETNQNSDD